MKLDLTSIDTINALRADLLKSNLGVEERNFIQLESTLKWNVSEDKSSFVCLAVKQNAWTDESWMWFASDVLPKDGYNSRHVKCSLGGHFEYDCTSEDDGFAVLLVKA
jgi:hypothetical protein